jgi:hypothetical protein
MPGAQQYDPATQQYKQSQFDGFPSFMQQQQRSPIASQGGVGGKGGMPGAQQYSYNPATQQFSQPQGLAALMGPQKSSTNSLQ